jgi:hypothetical protein
MKLAIAGEGRQGFDSAREKLEELMAFMKSPDAQHLSHSAMARLLRQEGNEVDPHPSGF